MQYRLSLARFVPAKIKKRLTRQVPSLRPGRGRKSRSEKYHVL